MNLKLVVLSMSVLGLVSCPTFAASTNSKHNKHRHHRMMKHAKDVQAVEHRDYKDMGALPVVEAACTVSQASIILDSTTQSMGRAMPNPCNPGWFNRIQFSGGLNVDVGKWGSRDQGYMGENVRRLSLNDAYLNMAATVNDWVKAFASISYNTATTVANPFYNAAGNIVPTGEYSAAYSANINSQNTTTALQLEQGYVTLANFDQSPIFVQVGKQFQDFSRYEIHPITRSMTQVLSETLATSGKIGFIVPMGLHGSVYVFDDPVNKIGQSSTPTNYGASLGFDQFSDQLGWGVGIAYLYNMIGANDTAYSVQNFTNGTGYNSRVGGVALYGDVNSGPFTLAARYTTALSKFSVLDLPKHGVADYVGRTVVPGATGTTTLIAGSTGAKPWAAGIQAGYSFDAWSRSQNIYLGYQASHEAAGLNLPKNRWLVGYGVDAYKYTTVGAEWAYDSAYNAANGGNNKNSNVFSIRVGTKFG
jgi:hypothetical protein